MTSSRTITLFSDPPPARRGPSAFLISVLLHGVALGLLTLALRHAPRVNLPLDQRYTVRLLNLRRPEPRLQRSGDSPAPQSVARAAASGGGASPPSASRQIAHTVPAPQTLVQPDLPPNLLLPQETPIPLVLMWAPENIPVRQIVPPPPQQATAANVRPSLDAPNRESVLADLRISATAFAPKAPALPPSTTSPIVVRGPEIAKQVPETTSKPLAPPTPARVMSLSDLRMPEGTVLLPLVNETAPAAYSGPLAPIQPENSAQGGSGNPADKQNGSGAGQNAGDQGARTAAAGGPAGQNGLNATPNRGSDAGSGLGNEPPADRINLPKDGQFGVVVVGSSVTEDYPEAQGVWAGRMAYTVYLHLGLAKSWIMQYSLPRSAEAAAAGNITRPEAPWPYLMVRPHLAPDDVDADAILVHGFVNAAGRFEKLAVVFPTDFAQGKFVLSALQQWQFRPATQNGQSATVEVLLIIPSELD